MNQVCLHVYLIQQLLAYFAGDEGWGGVEHVLWIDYYFVC